MAERIGTLLPKVLRQTATRQKTLRSIQRRWKRLVGKSLAAHTKPVSLRKGRLVVHVAEPGDSFVLTYERPRILKRLKTASAEETVEDLVFRAGDV